MSHKTGFTMEAGRAFARELAGRAAIHYFDRTWDEVLPVLAAVWAQDQHAMSWKKARAFAKQTWLALLDTEVAACARQRDGTQGKHGLRN
jgi:hypothetical protein